jgi:hypothetical protein
MGVIILTILLAEAAGAGSAHASSAAPPGSATQFEIVPTYIPIPNTRPRGSFIYHTNPGVLIQDSMHVTNISSARGSVYLYPVDATTSQASGAAFLVRSDPRREVGTWITFKSRQITLNPGQSQDVPFTVRIPGHVRPGQHVGGVIAEAVNQQALSEQQGRYKAQIKIQVRQVIVVLVNLPGQHVYHLEARGIHYDKKSTYQRVLVTLNNTGTQLLHPFGSLQITNTRGQHVQDISLKLNALLPQISIDYPVNILHKALQPGEYKALLILHYEPDNVVILKTSFDVPTPEKKSNSVFQKMLNLVTLPGQSSSDLPNWYYIAGIAVILALLGGIFSGLFIWNRRLSKSIAQLKQNPGSRAPK